MTYAELRILAEQVPANKWEWDGRKRLMLVLARTDRNRDWMRLCGRNGGPRGRVLGPTIDGGGTICCFFADEILRWLDRVEKRTEAE
jgi:hypothetical protein